MAADSPTKVSARQLIAADVGGTHARIALVGVGGDGRVEVLSHEKYACASFAGLADIFETFRHAADAESVDAIAVACAGFVVEGEIVNENLPWLVSIPELRRRLRTQRLAVVNDFKALAYALSRSGEDGVVLLPGAAVDEALPTLAIGPGTGLGSAVCIPDRGRTVVLATEAGHALLTPGNDVEIELLRVFRAAEPYVKTEHALSGPGLLNLHRALAQLRGARASFDTPAAITEAAKRGDALALETVRVATLGKKGSVSALLATMGRLDPEERKIKGPQFNGLKEAVTAAIAARKIELGDAALEQRLASEKLDVTLPARSENSGTVHPIAQVLEEVVAIFADLGFGQAGKEGDVRRICLERL